MEKCFKRYFCAYPKKFIPKSEICFFYHSIHEIITCKFNVHLMGCLSYIFFVLFNMYMKGLDVDQRFVDIYNPDSKMIQNSTPYPGVQTNWSEKNITVLRNKNVYTYVHRYQNCSPILHGGSTEPLLLTPYSLPRSTNKQMRNKKKKI